VTPERSFESGSAYIIAEKISFVKSKEGNNIHNWAFVSVEGGNEARKSLFTGVMERPNNQGSLVLFVSNRCLIVTAQGMSEK